MSSMRPSQIRSSKHGPVEHAEACALTAAFFDALGHFAGEVPVIEELQRVFAPNAQIDEVNDNDARLVRYDRDAWILHLAASAERRRGARLGYFFEEVERTMTESASDLHVCSVVDARLTRGGSIERVECLRCAMVVRRVGGRVAIVHLRVERGSAPAGM